MKTCEAVSDKSENVDVDGKPTIKIVKDGNVSVRILPTKKAGRLYWMIEDYSLGYRRRLNCKDLASAKERAKELAKAIHAGKAELLDAPPALVKEAEDALEILQGRATLVEAARYFMSKVGAFVPEKPRKAVNAFLEVKRLERLSDAHLVNLSYQAERFEEAFRDRQLHTITTAELRTYLLNMGLSANGTAYHRATINGIYKTAQENGWCPKDYNPVTDIKLKRQSDTEIDYFRVEQVRQILDAVVAKEADDLVPYVALAAFAGIRPEEIKRMRWEWIGQDAIRLPGRIDGQLVTKTGESRLIPVCPALKAWLAPHRKLTGPVMEGSTEKIVRRLRTLSGVTWVHDGLRHSFGTYRRAQTSSVEKVSEEMGNTPRVCKQHYANPLVTEAEATAFFGIMPADVTSAAA